MFLAHSCVIMKFLSCVDLMPVDSIVIVGLVVLVRTVGNFVDGVTLREVGAIGESWRHLGIHTGKFHLHSNIQQVVECFRPVNQNTNYIYLFWSENMGECGLGGGFSITCPSPFVT